MSHYAHVQQLLDRARARWRALTVARAATRGALAATVIALASAGAATVVVGSAFGLAAVFGVGAVATLVAIGWAAAPLRHVPSDARVARFVEEGVPELDDRLASAVDAATSERYAGSPVIVHAMLADAAERAQGVDLDRVIAPEVSRRAYRQLGGALAALLVALVVVRGPMRKAFDAALIEWWPSRVTLTVTPGAARVRAGAAVVIEASLSGNTAPVEPVLETGGEGHWSPLPMAPVEAGRFRVSLPSVRQSFQYRVVAGRAVSPEYAIDVLNPPRITRIDLEYTFPPGLGLKPHLEEDGGDIYAPAGTRVKLLVRTERAATGELRVTGKGTQALAPAGEAGVFTTSLQVTEEGSYRVALADSRGLDGGAETEYFIRTLEDRPPEVRILKPAADRRVTRLEEVEIQAQAEDDYGIDRLDLVYSVRGGPEKVVHLPTGERGTTVSGGFTLALEDLDVSPGDLISYYAQARDLTRGKRASEARSDIFFLEVKPFEQEFTLAQSQAMAGAGGNRSIDDLITAQKEVIVSTWKLDRRSQAARGAKSEQDIRTVARAEAELRTRVEQTAGTFREGEMRDPRRRQPQRGRGGQAPPAPGAPAGTALPEEDAMMAAAEAMGRAVVSLDGLQTSAALPSEMEALNKLLKAQADVKKRQVTRSQQAGSGNGNANRNLDLSTLFDRELQRTQQNNYETPNSAERKDEDARASALDQIKELARRQDELLKRQKALADKQGQLGEEERRRQLDKLTRDQLELRQRADDMARQMTSQSSRGQQSQQGQQGQQGQGGQQAGQRSQSGQQGQQAQGGRASGQASQESTPSAQGQNPQGAQAGDRASRMRDAADAMRNAASDLRRQDASQATADANRALDRLREVERQLQAAPRQDERGRALGDMQHESRRLADAERQVASELSKLAQGQQGEAAQDGFRRLAGEQERIAESMRRLQGGVKQQATQAGAGGSTDSKNPPSQASQLARDLDRQRLAERLQQSADALRQAGEPPAPADNRSNRRQQPAAPRAELDVRRQAEEQRDLARALDGLADKLAAAQGARDAETRRLSDQLSRAQQLRQQLDKAGRDLAALGQNTPPQAQPGQPQGQGGQKASGETGQTGQGQGGGMTGGDLSRLREQAERQLQQTRDLLEQLRKEDPASYQAGNGFTFEGQGMTLSSPGTEAFKQDFAKWEDLKRQATQALDRAELLLATKLKQASTADRLAAGTDDTAPAQYQKQVDSYFKALATRKKPQ